MFYHSVRSPEIGITGISELSADTDSKILFAPVLLALLL
jgi:hypothetical protein